MSKLEYVEIGLDFSDPITGEITTVAAMCRSKQDEISESLMERLKSGTIVDGTIVLLVRENDGNELTFWISNLFSHTPGKPQSKKPEPLPTEPKKVWPEPAPLPGGTKVKVVKHL